MAKYTLMKTEGRAKRAQFETVHGTIQTPVFMNVGTIGAIKGAVSTQDLMILEHRWSCLIPIICMCVQVTK